MCILGWTQVKKCLQHVFSNFTYKCKRKNLQLYAQNKHWRDIKQAMIIAVMNAVAYRSLRKSELQQGLTLWPRDTGATLLSNWAMNPLTLGAGHLWVLMSTWGMNVKWYMKYFIYWTADLKSSKLWSSQSWTQFKQLRIEVWKSQDFNGLWRTGFYNITYI